MNDSLPFLDRAAAAWFTHATVMLWQVALVVAVLWLADRWLAPRVRAVTRHALWLLVLVKLVLPPSLSVPTAPAYWWRDAARAEATLSVRFTETSLDASNESRASQLEAPSIRPGKSASPWSPVTTLFLLWLTGALAGTAWIGVQTIRLHHSLRRHRAAQDAMTDAVLACELTHAAAALGLRRVPCVVRTDALPGPAVAGLWRPTLILPASGAATLQPVQWRGVLLHELAHVRRGDLWVNAAQVALQLLYWWHPAVWLANARLRRVREEATDETVIATSAEAAADYAQTLVQVARRLVQRRTLALGLLGIVESKRALQARIERILDCDPTTLDGARLGRAGWRACVALGLVLLPLASRPGMAQGERQPSASAIKVAPVRPESAEVSPVAPRSWSTNPQRNSRRGAETLSKVFVSTEGLDGVSLEMALNLLNNRLRGTGQQGAQPVVRLEILSPSKSPKLATGSDPLVLEDTARYLEDIGFRLRTQVIQMPLRSPCSLSEILYAIIAQPGVPKDYAYDPASGVVQLFAKLELMTRIYRLHPELVVEVLARKLRSEDRRTGMAAQLRALIEREAEVLLNPPSAVFYDERTGSLMVRATEPELAHVSRLIHDVFRSAPQLQVETKIVVVDNLTAKVLAVPDLALQQARRTEGAGILTEPQFGPIIRALEQQKNSEVLASPRITTLSGREAVVEIASPEAKDNEPRQPGVQIKILPEVVDDGTMVRLVTRSELIHLVDLTAPRSPTSPPAPGTTYAVNAQGYIVTSAQGEVLLFDGQTAVLEVPAPDAGVVAGAVNPFDGRRFFVFLTVTLIDSAGNRVHAPDPANGWPPVSVPPQPGVEKQTP